MKSSTMWLESDDRLPTVRHRLMAAIIIGAIAGLFTFAYHRARPATAPDFIYPWTAARILLSGANPYTALPGGLAEPFDAPLLYPLPAVIVTYPFAGLGLPLAVGIFVGLSASFLAFTVTRQSWHTLLYFASTPLLLAVMLGQWSPLLTAAALLPAGGFMAVAKPNLGLALTVYRPTRAGLLGCVAFLVLSVLILPSWPRDWVNSLHLDRLSGTHVAPITTPLGPLLALAIMRWRRPEARLLIAMACVPQLLFFYDQLPLILVPESRQESFAYIVPSGVAYLVWMLVGHHTRYAPEIAEWCVMLGIYIPCLIMVLRRPNVGSTFACTDRYLASVLTRLGRNAKAAL